MTSSLLHLPSRATPSPTPSSSSPPVQPASPSPPPASSSPGAKPIPGTALKKKQSSLTSFLSPAAKQQPAASQAGASGAAVTDFLGGHSQDFIEQSWQQRLHGRQPSEPPVLMQPQVTNRQQQQKRTEDLPGVVTKEKGVKRPLEFPEDINALLPPEWGGKAAKADKAKGKSKAKGKMSLTAQYLHPDTIQHPSHSAMQNRPAQLSAAHSSSASNGSAAQPQQQPHTRPSAAAAVASAQSRFESQQAQHAQQAQQTQQLSSSSVPWFSSNSSAARSHPQSPVKTTHSFGDWLLQPPWGQLPSQSQHSPLCLLLLHLRTGLQGQKHLPCPCLSEPTTSLSSV